MSALLASTGSWLPATDVTPPLATVVCFTVAIIALVTVVFLMQARPNH